jgi:hypothetical protein
LVFAIYSLQRLSCSFSLESIALFKPSWSPKTRRDRSAQLSMLLEGIDWRRPLRTQTPQLAV